jgi:4-amino-4-deoxy-L-arabinose transferase-like glycosyltransferase
MTQVTRLDELARGWRGRLLAAFFAVLIGLPGLIALPALDRDEARFAQATAQMLETGDFISINYQDQPREKKPVGIHWLQAASVAAFSSAEARQIWAYRIPSLLGAALAAAACVWGASAFFGPRVSLAAGAVLAATALLSTESGIAKTDAVLCGTVTLSLAALAQIYAAVLRGEAPRRRVKLLFWLGFAVAMLDKGPVGPMVIGLAGLALAVSDRKTRWAGSLGWGWGLILVAAIVGPWAVAITVRTDGAFWTHAIGGDMAPKLKGGQEGHFAPPGIYALMAPLVTFPASALLPAAAVGAWTRRREPGVRFALCWLIPAWLVFEAAPTKLVHYPLPTYPAIAWLAAAAFAEPTGRWSRRIAVVLAAIAGLVWAAVPIAAAASYGQGVAIAVWAGLAAAFAAAAAAASILAVLWREAPRWRALAAALILGAGAHALIVAAVAPGLAPLWLSQRLASLLDADRLNPRGGLAPGPVAAVGYAEPSLVFTLGTETELGDVSDAAEAISEGRPVVVEKRLDPAFRAELADDGLRAQPAGSIAGLDYSSGRKEVLTVYRSANPALAAP